MFSVKGQVVLVTGGSKGIGRGIASAFLEAQADVFICGRTPPDEVLAVNQRQATFIQADVRDPDQAEALIRQVIEQAGRLDTLINNAGGGPPAESASVSPRFTESIIRLNLLAPLLMSQVAHSALQASLRSSYTCRSSAGTAVHVVP